MRRTLLAFLLLVVGACANVTGPGSGPPTSFLSDATLAAFGCSRTSATVRQHWQEGRGQLPAEGASHCAMLGRLGDPASWGVTAVWDMYCEVTVVFEQRTSPITVRPAEVVLGLPFDGAVCDGDGGEVITARFTD